MSAPPRMNGLAERKHLLVRKADLQRSLIEFEWRRLHDRVGTVREQLRPSRSWLIGGAVGLALLFVVRGGWSLKRLLPLLTAIRIGRMLKG